VSPLPSAPGRTHAPAVVVGVVRAAHGVQVSALDEVDVTHHALLAQGLARARVPLHSGFGGVVACTAGEPRVNDGIKAGVGAQRGMAGALAPAGQEGRSRAVLPRH